MKRLCFLCGFTDRNFGTAVGQCMGSGFAGQPDYEEFVLCGIVLALFMAAKVKSRWKASWALG